MIVLFFLNICIFHMSGRRDHRSLSTKCVCLFNLLRWLPCPSESSPASMMGFTRPLVIQHLFDFSFSSPVISHLPFYILTSFSTPNGQIIPFSLSLSPPIDSMHYIPSAQSTLISLFLLANCYSSCGSQPKHSFLWGAFLIRSPPPSRASCCLPSL